MATPAERIAAARARKEAAEAAFTEADRKRQAERAEAEKAEEEAREAERAHRVYKLDGRVDALQEKLGPRVSLRAYDAEAKFPGAGTFVLRGPAKADCDRWQNEIAKHVNNPALREKAGEDFAMQCVVEWNARDLDPSVDGDAAHEVRKVFGRFGMLATTVTNIGTELAGLDLAARKS